MSTKPLGTKGYGSIPHLPGSRLGPGEHTVHAGQARIATVAVRDKYDTVIVQEKLDGSNVAVLLKDGHLLPITRAGYLAITSPWEQHRYFYEFVTNQASRFRAVLQEGERLVGEWLMQAHSTRYEIDHTSTLDMVFRPFDLMRDHQRTPYFEFQRRIAPGRFVSPQVVSFGPPHSTAWAMAKLDERPGNSHIRALDPVEGAVWRIERDVRKKDGSIRHEVDFLVKYVRPDKVDGVYLGDDVPVVWNVTPERLHAAFKQESEWL